jgi:hypothetical protein
VRAEASKWSMLIGQAQPNTERARTSGKRGTTREKQIFASGMRRRVILQMGGGVGITVRGCAKGVVDFPVTPPLI